MDSDVRRPVRSLRRLSMPLILLLVLTVTVPITAAASAKPAAGVDTPPMIVFGDPPGLYAVTPEHAAPSAAVTLTGSLFGASQSDYNGYVTFGATRATDILSWSDTSISLNVPGGLLAGTLPLKVTTNWGGSNVLSFMVDGIPRPAPVIASVTPAHAVAGAAVTVAGGDFGGVQGAGTLTFGGVTPEITSWSDTAIACKVPAPLSPGVVDVVVTTTSGASSPVAFTVDAPLKLPVIAKISPTRGKVGITVTITGANFGARRGTSKVLFGAKAVVRYYSWSSTRIKVKVPAIGQGRRALRVRTPVGASNTKYFTRI